MAFKDHFSSHADAYTRFRPGYPRELYQFLAGLVAPGDGVWDCGCGNGQAAVGLAEFFDSVVATDPSGSQIAHAQPHPRVIYKVCPAEKVDLPDGSVGLITVAQALHWFDFEGFYREVRRVSRPGAILVAWTYSLARISPEIDEVIGRFYNGTLAGCWPPERRLIEEKYAPIPFPFEPIVLPAFAMTAQWRLDALIGYLGTWSAVAQFKQRHGADPLAAITNDLMQAWAEPNRIRTVTWPLIFLAGKVAERK